MKYTFSYRLDTLSSSLQLAKLVDMSCPQTVLAEVRFLLREAAPALNTERFAALFEDVVLLFNGRFPGYQACNTAYHNLKHTTDNVMALARLMHGAWASGALSCPLESIEQGLIAALFHDIGYLQETEDNNGSGAKHTKMHVKRSMAFADRYLIQKDFPAPYRESVAHIIAYTEISHSPETPFLPKEIEQIGQMEGTADLLGQMADRTYLEKLLLLYLEFREGGIPGYEVEFDVLEKTLPFYNLINQRLVKNLNNVQRFMLPHFRKRWNLDCDLYALAIKNNLSYLNRLISDHPKDYRAFLRRDNIVNELMAQEKEGR